MICSNILETIGHTPLVRIQEGNDHQAEILVKVESRNPGGSIKDRIAYHMVMDALEKGTITHDSVLIEPTSGNTGIGLAMVCAVLKMRCIIVMPESMSEERKKLMRAFGAELYLSPADQGMSGAIALADKLKEENPGSMILQQFDNPENPVSHKTTAREILEDCGEKLDAIVAGAGTGGTLMGLSTYLRQTIPSLYVMAVEPYDSPLMSKGISGPHGLQGIGANFIPSIIDPKVFNEIFTVKDEEAYEAARYLSTRKGILAGITSGAALHAAMHLARRPEWANKRIVVILPDTGERYISTDLFR